MTDNASETVSNGNLLVRSARDILQRIERHTTMADDEFVDFYDLLGVEPDASTEDITRAYRKKAQKCHPDKNPDDPNAAALFVEVTKVKDLLIDPEERAKFDRQRTARLQKAEKFKQMDEQHQRMRTDLEAREREAEARAKMVAHKAQAKTVQSLRADSVALMERINAELAASKASAAAGAVASAKGSGSGSGDGGMRAAATVTIEGLEAQEAKVFAAMKSFGAKKRRKTATAGPTSMQDDEL